MGNGSSLENEIFNLKFAAKQMQRQSQQCTKAEKTEKLKVKQSIEKGNNDIARIHAENAIRQKTQALSFLRLASRMEAIVQRMQSAQSMKMLNKSMTSVTKVMQTAIESMDLEKITKTMDQFEKNFEELDIQSSVMESAIQQSTGNMLPEDQVDNLMKEVADEHGIALAANLSDVPIGKKEQVEDPELALQKRFAELKNNH